MLGQFVGGFITILVGVTLAPVVGDLVQQAQYHNATIPTNVTGAPATLVGLTTLFFSLAVTSAGIGMAAQGLRAAGML